MEATRGAVGAVSLLLLGSAGAFPCPAAGQETPEEVWNSPRALELVERGREARQRLTTEGLETYRARTRGNIYFYVDPEEGGERTLLRTDQVAVDLYWMAPDHTRQVIVGHREEKLLPIRDFDYFLDRLTLVQHGLGDRIRVGEGMDVEDVPHPLAPEGIAGATYDYRLADSVTVSLPGGEGPIRVYELEVRPREPSRPAVVGTLRLDRRTGSLVRMDITFTPAAYVDPRNDRVRVTLEYGLWEGRHWLPHEQRVEVRRELPQLDVGFGTVILAVLRTRDYELDIPLDSAFFRAPRVTSRPEEELEAFPFESDPLELLQELGRSARVQEMSAAELRRQAREALERSDVSGLPSVRFHLPGASSLLRFNRAEGWRVGGGLALRPHALVDLRLHGGYAFGRGQPSFRGEVGVAAFGPSLRLETSLYARDVVDLGPQPGADGLLNSFSALTRGTDYLDPYARDGVELGLRHSRPEGWEVDLTGRIERHRSLRRTQERAPFREGSLFRPVREVDETWFAGLRLDLSRDGAAAFPQSSGWRASFEAGSWDEGTFAKAEASASTLLASEAPGAGLELALQGGTSLGSVPLQRHALLGGRHTIPGHAFRAFAGRHYVQGRAVWARDAIPRWLRPRIGLWGGWAGDPSEEARARWNVEPTGGARWGGTLGAGLFYDLLRVEVARGVPRGEWQLLLYLDPAWWDRL